jgi:cytochrome c1
MLPNTAENLVAWIRDPQGLKPGAKMPALGLTEPQARLVAAYLLALQ